MGMLRMLAAASAALLALSPLAAAQPGAPGSLFCYDSGDFAAKSQVTDAVTAYCEMWQDHVMPVDESIWNTFSLPNAQAVKLNVFFSSSKSSDTYTLGLSECEGYFQILQENCLSGQDGTRGGNYVEESGKVYWMMTIDPPADQRTNGTFNKKQSDNRSRVPAGKKRQGVKPLPISSLDTRTISTASTEGTSLQPVQELDDLFRRQTGPQCWSNYGPQSTSSVIEDFTNFCSVNAGKPITPSISVPYGVGLIGVGYCNPTSPWTATLNYADCISVFTSVTKNCATEHDEMDGGQYRDLNNCLLWQLELATPDTKARDAVTAPAVMLAVNSLSGRQTGPSCDNRFGPQMFLLVFGNVINFCRANSGMLIRNSLSIPYSMGTIGVGYCDHSKDYSTYMDYDDCIYAFTTLAEHCYVDDLFISGGTYTDDEKCLLWQLWLSQPDVKTRDAVTAPVLVPVADEASTTMAQPVHKRDLITCGGNSGPQASYNVTLAYNDFCTSNNGAMIFPNISTGYTVGTVAVGYCADSPIEVIQTVNYDQCISAFDQIVSACAIAGGVFGGAYTESEPCLVWELILEVPPVPIDVQKAALAVRSDASIAYSSAEAVQKRDLVTCAGGWGPQSSTNARLAYQGFCEQKDGSIIGEYTSITFNLGTIDVGYCADKSSSGGVFQLLDYDQCISVFGQIVSDCPSSRGDGTVGGVYTQDEPCLIWRMLLAKPPRGSPQAVRSDAISRRIAGDVAKRESGSCDTLGINTAVKPISDYVDSFCRAHNGQQVAQGRGWYGTGYIVGTDIEVTLSMRYDEDPSYPASYTLDQSVCSSAAGLGWILQNCQAGGGNVYGGNLIVDGGVTWSMSFRYKLGAFPFWPPWASDGPTIPARQVDTPSCSHGSLAASTDIENAATSFCTQYEANLPLGATQSHTYSLSNGHHATLSRSSSCTDPNYEQIGFGLCYSPFEDIVNQCQADDGSGELSGGSVKVWDCVTYEVSIGSPAGARQVDTVNCAKGSLASSTDLGNAAVSFCKQHGSAQIPSTTQSKSYGLPDGKQATLSRSSTCTAPTNEQDDCVSIFHHIIGKCQANEGPGATSGGSAVISGCVEYEISVGAATKARSATPGASTGNQVTCGDGTTAAPSVAVQKYTDTFCQHMSGSLVPARTTLSQQFNIPQEEDNGACLTVQTTIATTCDSVTIGQDCASFFDDIMDDCDNGNTATPGGQNLVDGCVAYSFEILVRSNAC